MTAQRFLKRCCWSGCGKVKPWERGVFLCTLADVCSSFGHKVRTLHLCPWLLPSKWPLLSPARDSPSETCTNPKGEATDSCWQKTLTEDILRIFVAEHVWTKVLLCMAIFPYISQVLQGVASVTSCHFNVFYIFLLFSTFEAKVPTSCGDCFGILRRWWTSFGLQLGCASSAWTLGTHEAGVVLQCNIRIALWHDHMILTCVDRMCGSVLEYVGSR